jgi:parvulin-like peptidyl-prolyl isomerase
MYKLIIFSLIIASLLLGCGQDTTKLEKGTPEYEFAKKIAEKEPYFDPDVNNPVITTNKFKMTSGKLLGTIYLTAGNRTSQFLSLDSTVPRDVLVNNAQQLAEKELLLEAAEKRNIQVSQEMLDSLLNQQYMRHGSRERFVENLKKMGVDITVIEQQMNESLIIETYLNEVLAEKMEITDERLMEAYNEDKTATVRHILLSTQGKNDTEKQKIRQKMEGILEEARSGKDFAELAKKYTEDPGSKNTGGLYENFSRGVMVKPFEEAAFSVPVGEISDIVETNYGYHILKVLDRKQEDKPFDEVKEQLRNQMVQTSRRDLYFEHVEELRKNADFTIIEF